MQSTIPARRGRVTLADIIRESGIEPTDEQSEQISDLELKSLRAGIEDLRAGRVRPIQDVRDALEEAVRHG